jgi:hypothetical protein
MRRLARVALERDDLVGNELPRRLLQLAQVRGDLEVHGFGVAGVDLILQTYLFVFRWRKPAVDVGVCASLLRCGPFAAGTWNAVARSAIASPGLDEASAARTLAFELWFG